MTRLTVTGIMSCMTRPLVFLTTSEVAAVFGVAQETVRRWCIAYRADPAKGIRSISLPSGVYRIPEEAVREILDSGQTPDEVDSAAVA